ncbi:unnamed protein product [Linum tenue]|uniref:VOC domain-containing protein n=1 Tax=Linum tenue TaxID=586396 RepID=A0AAV0HY59_9ROSI|nr:unnamed protein product [Linum tenue]
MRMRQASTENISSCILGKIQSNIFLSIILSPAAALACIYIIYKLSNPLINPFSILNAFAIHLFLFCENQLSNTRYILIELQAKGYRREKEKMIMKKSSISNNPLQLKSLNHISVACRSLERSLEFYQNVLGFFPIRRPGSFNFDGAWIGIHLLQCDDLEEEDVPAAGITRINPKDNHISFQCESMAMAEKKLKEMEVEYVKSRVEEGGVYVDQLFFHDPDGHMVEICNCDNLPVVPLLPAAAAVVVRGGGCRSSESNILSLGRPCSTLNSSTSS